MNTTILSIPADNTGNKLFLKDLRKDDKRLFVKYRSTFNDIPFLEVELFYVDGNYVITGDDGTVLWRFSEQWLDKLK